MSDETRGPEGEGTTVSDADLIDYLHDELSASARTRVEAHIAASHAAARRLETLRRREARLSTMLGALDPGTVRTHASAQAVRAMLDRGARAPTRGRSQLLRAATIGAVLLGGLLAVQPVRAYVAESLHSLAAALGLVDPAATPEPAVQQVDAGSVRIGIAWRGAELRLDVAGTRGTLEMRRGTDNEQVFLSYPSAADVVVLPDGLRIAAPATGLYTLELPPHVERVRLARGTEDEVHEAPAAGSVRVQLAPE
jgi:hypothetical protein